MEPHRAIWEARYERLLREERVVAGEPWLEDWLHLVPRSGPRRALDLGCGTGHNTKLLLSHGFEVTAIDFSQAALTLCRREAPAARVEWGDLREGLPFVGERFELIVADLSLHYFPWETTVSILGDVAERLVPDEVFAGRFNSTGDANYGASSGDPVAGESNLLRVKGIEKRFFTRDCCERLFAPPWQVETMEERTSSRFGADKVFWEVVARVGAASC